MVEFTLLDFSLFFYKVKLQHENRSDRPTRIYGLAPIPTHVISLHSI